MAYKLQNMDYKVIGSCPDYMGEQGLVYARAHIIEKAELDQPLPSFSSLAVCTVSNENWAGARVVSVPDPEPTQHGLHLVRDTGSNPRWGWFGSGAETIGLGKKSRKTFLWNIYRSVPLIRPPICTLHPAQRGEGAYF